MFNSAPVRENIAQRRWCPSIRHKFSANGIAAVSEGPEPSTAKGRVIIGVRKDNAHCPPLFLVLCVHWAKVLTVNSCFQCFSQAFWKWPRFIPHPLLKSSPCHVTEVKCYDFLGYCITPLLVFDYSEFQEFLLNTLKSRKFLVKSVGTKSDFWEKCT